MNSTVFTPKEEPQINWNKIQFLKCKNNNTIVLTTGDYTDTQFNGIVMHSNDESHVISKNIKQFLKCYYDVIKSGSSLTINF